LFRLEDSWWGSLAALVMSLPFRAMCSLFTAAAAALSTAGQTTVTEASLYVTGIEMELIISNASMAVCDMKLFLYSFSFSQQRAKSCCYLLYDFKQPD